jgi:hypothetical protein
MRRLLAPLLSAGLLAAPIFAPLPAWACVNPAEKAAFQVQGVKSELMVVAITCQAQDRYNAFVSRFRDELQSGERTLRRYFARTSGSHAQRDHDAYITALANAQMQDGLRQGDQFCTQRMPLFDSVMALHGLADLSAYADSNGLAQAADLTECPAPAPKKKVTRTASKK